MDRQGGGCLVFTNQALTFISKEKSSRILLSHILSFEAGSGGGADDYEFSIETDHARNNSHRFSGINPVNVNFIKSVLELLANGPPPVAPSTRSTPPPLPAVAAPVSPPTTSILPPTAPVLQEEMLGHVTHLKFTHTDSPETESGS